MSSASAWRQASLPGELADVAARLPARVEAGRAELRITGAAEPGTSASGALRFPTTWSAGRATGGGHVELAQAGSGSLLLEVRLDAPRGPRGWLWPSPRLERLAVVVLTALRTGGRLAPATEGSRRLAPATEGLRRLAPATDGSPGLAPASDGSPASAAAPGGQRGQRRQRHRRRAAVGVATLTILTLAGAAVTVSGLLAPTPVTIDESVTAFRESLVLASPTAQQDDGAPGADEPPDPTRTNDPDGRQEAGPDSAAGVADPDPAPMATQGAADAGRTEGVRDPADPAGSGSGDPPAAPGGGSGPEPGVYVYATSGGERISMPGGQRDYPAQTTMTVSRQGCGTVLRWQVLRERWDEYEVCRSQGSPSLERLTMYREFFGQSERYDLRCDGGPAQPPSREPGTQWTVHCDDETVTSVNHSTLVGIETVTVAGTPVEAYHVRMVSRMDGSTRGERRAHRWTGTATGLLLRETVVTDVEVDAFPRTLDYHEEYDIRLEHLEPRR